MKTYLIASFAALSLLGACASKPDAAPMTASAEMPALSGKDVKQWNKAEKQIAKGEKLIANAETDLRKAEAKADKARTELRKAENAVEGARDEKRKGEKLVKEGTAAQDKLTARAAKAEKEAAKIAADKKIRQNDFEKSLEPIS